MGRAGTVELQALNQAAATNLTRRCIAFRQPFELLLQIRAHTDDVFQQLVFFNDGQILECDPARPADLRRRWFHVARGRWPMRTLP